MIIIFLFFHIQRNASAFPTNSHFSSVSFFFQSLEHELESMYELKRRIETIENLQKSPITEGVD